jgi:hypothetical protein
VTNPEACRWNLISEKLIVDVSKVSAERLRCVACLNWADRAILRQWNNILGRFVI